MTKYRDLIRWPMSVPRELTPWPKKTFAVSYKSPQYYAVAACDSGGYLLGFKRRHKFGVMMSIQQLLEDGLIKKEQLL